MKKFIEYCSTILFLFLFCFSLSSCSYFKVKPETIPAGCENSVIYKTIPYANLSGSIVNIAGLEVFKQLKKSNYNIDFIFTTLNDELTILDTPNLTYSQFIIFTLEKNKFVQEWAGLELIILDSFLQQFQNNTTVMDSCDRTFIQHQLQTQIAYLKLLG